MEIKFSFSGQANLLILEGDILEKVKYFQVVQHLYPGWFNMEHSCGKGCPQGEPDIKIQCSWQREGMGQTQ